MITCLVLLEESQVQECEFASLCEVRSDYFIPEDLSRYPDKSRILLTYRSKQEGGLGSNKTEQRAQFFKDIRDKVPHAWLDLEYERDLEYLKKVSTENCKIILSAHLFNTDPLKLIDYLKKMFEVKADYYKLAYQCKDPRLFEILRQVKTQFSEEKIKKLILVALGSEGQVSRVLFPFFLAPFVFISPQNGRLLQNGILTFSSLNTYWQNVDSFREGKLLGLIGDPVKQSPSHSTHNFILKYLDLKAAYLKYDCDEIALKNLLSDAKSYDTVLGFSITVPHKQEVLNWIDEIDPLAKSVGAVNTLKLDEGKWKGTNTDVLSFNHFLDPLNRKQRVLILGAGGSAKAALSSLKHLGFEEVTVANRNLKRAQEITYSYAYAALPLNEALTQGIDSDTLLIHTLPVSAWREVWTKSQLERVSPSFLIDIVNGGSDQWSFGPLVEKAKQNNIPFVSPKDFFEYQAIQQFKYWFEGVSTKECLEAFKEWNLLQEGRHGLERVTH